MEEQEQEQERNIKEIIVLKTKIVKKLKEKKEVHNIYIYCFSQVVLQPRQLFQTMFPVKWELSLYR